MVKPKGDWPLKKLIKKAADVNLNTAIALSKSLVEDVKTKKRQMKEVEDIPLNLMLEPHKVKEILNNRLGEFVLQPFQFTDFKPRYHRAAKNWDKAALYNDISPGDLSYENINISEQMEFYVQSLMPPISPSKIRVGDKIFKKSQIAGRENSVTDNPTQQQESAAIDYPSPEPQAVSSDSLSTLDRALPISTGHISAPCISDVFYPSIQNVYGDSEMTDNLEEDRFMSMFNSHRYSDLLVLMKSGEILNLHKFVLAAWQCDADAIREDQYFVTDVEDEIVIKIFKYLYSNGKFRIDDIIGKEECTIVCQKFGIDQALLRPSKKLSSSLVDISRIETMGSQNEQCYNHIVQNINISADLSPIRGPTHNVLDKRDFGIFLSTPNIPIHDANRTSPNEENAPAHQHYENNSSDTDLFASLSQNITIESTCMSNQSSELAPHSYETRRHIVAHEETDSPTKNNNHEKDSFKKSFTPTVEDAPNDDDDNKAVIMLSPQKYFINNSFRPIVESVSKFPNGNESFDLLSPQKDFFKYSFPSITESASKVDDGDESLILTSPTKEFIKNSLPSIDESASKVDDGDESLILTSPQKEFSKNSLPSIDESASKVNGGDNSFDLLSHQRDIPNSPLRYYHKYTAISSPTISESADQFASPLPLFQRMKMKTQIEKPVISTSSKEGEAIAQPIVTKRSIKKSLSSNLSNKLRLSKQLSLTLDSSATEATHKLIEPKKKKVPELTVPPHSFQIKVSKEVEESKMKKERKRTITPVSSATVVTKVVKEPQKKKVRMQMKDNVFETPPRGNKLEINPFTPMPDFDNTATPERKGKLEIYGTKKNLPKKTSIIMLKELHRFTHRVDNGADTESTSSEDASDPSSRVPFKIDVQTLECTSQNHVEANDASIDEAIYHFMKANYFLEILTYKSVDVVKIVSELKSQQVKVNNRMILDFLDEQCITYKMDKESVVTNKYNRAKRTKKHVI